jgi:uncharacterized membrane protein (DUF485 family)
MTEQRREDIARLAGDQWRIAVRLTVAMMAVYLGFTLLVAYDKPLLGRELVPGLSWGILLGALVIVAAWAFVWIYVRWANRHFDATVDRLRREGR